MDGIAVDGGAKEQGRGGLKERRVDGQRADCGCAGTKAGGVGQICEAFVHSRNAHQQFRIC